MAEKRPGALIAVNKPSGLTSHDVVARVRKGLSLRRVGHAGTLDPLATGVLIVGLGEATRLLGLITLARKSYVAEFVFGARTTTDDAEGALTAEAPVPRSLSEEGGLERAVASLVGPKEQVPPAFSAVSKGGRRAYAAARAGEALELEPRPVEVYEAQLLSSEASGGRLRACVALTVSKGCYVRSLARDLGDELGCGAYVGSLVRTASGPVRLGSCLTLEEIAEDGWSAVADRALDAIAVAGLTRRDLTPAQARRASQGQPLALMPEDGDGVGLVWDGLLHGVWEPKAGELRCKANFPEGIVLGANHDA